MKMTKTICSQSETRKLAVHFQFFRLTNVDSSARVFPDHHKIGETLEFYQYWVVKIKDIRARGEDVDNSFILLLVRD